LLDVQKNSVLFLVNGEIIEQKIVMHYQLRKNKTGTSFTCIKSRSEHVRIEKIERMQNGISQNVPNHLFYCPGCPEKALCI